MNIANEHRDGATGTTRRENERTQEHDARVRERLARTSESGSAGLSFEVALGASAGSLNVRCCRNFARHDSLARDTPQCGVRSSAILARTKLISRSHLQTVERWADPPVPPVDTQHPQPYCVLVAEPPTHSPGQCSRPPMPALVLTSRTVIHSLHAPPVIPFSCSPFPPSSCSPISASALPQSLLYKRQPPIFRSRGILLGEGTQLVLARLLHP